MMAVLLAFAAGAAAAEDVQEEMPEEPFSEDSGEGLCMHENTETQYYFDFPVYRAVDDLCHAVNGTALVSVVCLDCGEVISVTEENNAEEIRPHVFRNGQCALCGWEGGPQETEDAPEYLPDGEYIPAEPADLPADGEDVPAGPADVPAGPADVPEEPADVPAEPADVPEEPADIPAEPADLPADGPAEPADLPGNPADIPADKADVPADIPAEPADLPADIPAEPEGMPAETGGIPEIREGGGAAPVQGNNPAGYSWTLTAKDLEEAGETLELRPEDRVTALVMQTEPLREEFERSGGFLTAEIVNPDDRCFSAAVLLYDAGGMETVPGGHMVSLRIYGGNPGIPVTVSFTGRDGATAVGEAVWAEDGRDESYWNIPWLGNGMYELQ